MALSALKNVLDPTRDAHWTARKATLSSPKNATTEEIFFRLPANCLILDYRLIVPVPAVMVGPGTYVCTVIQKNAAGNLVLGASASLDIAVINPGKLWVYDRTIAAHVSPGALNVSGLTQIAGGTSVGLSCTVSNHNITSQAKVIFAIQYMRLDLDADFSLT
jgi:hypothetical protein